MLPRWSWNTQVAHFDLPLVSKAEYDAPIARRGCGWRICRSLGPFLSLEVIRHPHFLLLLPIRTHSMSSPPNSSEMKATWLEP